MYSPHGLTDCTGTRGRDVTEAGCVNLPVMDANNRPGEATQKSVEDNAASVLG